MFHFGPSYVPTTVVTTWIFRLAFITSSTPTQQAEHIYINTLLLYCMGTLYYEGKFSTFVRKLYILFEKKIYSELTSDHKKKSFFFFIVSQASFLINHTFYLICITSCNKSKVLQCYILKIAKSREKAVKFAMSLWNMNLFIRELIVWYILW